MLHCVFDLLANYNYMCQIQLYGSRDYTEIIVYSTYSLFLFRMNTPLSQVFTNDFWGLPLSDPESHKSYRPLVVLSFRANRLLHGLWPFGFHLINTVLHAVVSGLYCWVLGRLRLNWNIVMTASLLFASHPIHTEAVS